MFTLTFEGKPLATAPLPQPLYDAAVELGLAARAFGCLAILFPNVRIKKS